MNKNSQELISFIKKHIKRDLVLNQRIRLLYKKRYYIKIVDNNNILTISSCIYTLQPSGIGSDIQKTLIDNLLECTSNTINNSNIKIDYDIFTECFTLTYSVTVHENSDNKYDDHVFYYLNTIDACSLIFDCIRFVRAF